MICVGVFMKRLFVSLLAGIVILGLCGCQSTARTNVAENTSNIKIGIIETTGYKNKSYIHFLDDDLNYIAKKENEYASLSEPFDYPIYKNGDLFVIPKGEFEKRKEKCILRYHLQSDRYEEYDTGLQSMNRMAVSKDYIFGVNTINNTSTIVRCSINQRSDTLSAQFPDLYISELVVLNETLYAIFNSNLHEVFFVELSVETLEIIHQYDITPYGSPCSFIEHDDKIYISNQYADSISGEPSTLLTVFDKVNQTFSQINTKEQSPNNLVVLNDLLFISHYDRVQATGNQISVMDLNTNECNAYEFEHPVKQIASDGTFLYLLGENQIYKYKFENQEFLEVGDKKLDTDRSGTFFYITSFFLCN